MYEAYFVDTLTGELFKSVHPETDPKGIEWERVSYDEFQMLKKVAKFAATKRYWFINYE